MRGFPKNSKGQSFYLLPVKIELLILEHVRREKEIKIDFWRSWALFWVLVVRAARREKPSGIGYNEKGLCEVMTDKKEGTSVPEEVTEQDKAASFAVEGADALIEEALATMEMNTSALEQEIQPETSASDSTANESEILWEEPEEEPASDSDTDVIIDEDANERISELEAQLTEAQTALETEAAERKKSYEQLLRMTAEFDNFRKRTQREKEELRKFGHKDVMADFLDVIDNFDRALQTIGDAEESTREGILMVHKQFVDILSRHGVKKFESKGEPFDYTKHQAISVFETSEFPPQIVHESFKEGYDFHDQLLRPAMVVVTKAAPAPVAEAPEETTPDADGEEASSEDSEVQED